MQTKNIRRDDLELAGDRADVLTTSLSASLLVSGLYAQLSRNAQLYPGTDYLTPILDSVRYIRRNKADEPLARIHLEDAVRRILFTVIEYIERDWDFSIDEFGKDLATGESGDLDVLELYQFFISERNRNSQELIYQTLLEDRKKFVQAYKKSVNKTNQSVSEYRKFLLNFDDVVIWASIPDILSELANGDHWSTNLDEVFLAINCTPNEGGILQELSMNWDDPTFSKRYADPTLQSSRSGLITAIRARWLNEAEKKPIINDNE